MLFLGLLLLAATAAFTGLAISDNLGGGPHYTVSVLGNDIATMNTPAAPTMPASEPTGAPAPPRHRGRRIHIFGH